MLRRGKKVTIRGIVCDTQETVLALLAEQGVDTVVLDERKVAGGQYYKQPVAGDRLHRSLAGDGQIIGQ